MKISIVTVCYNSEHTLRDTFESVLRQTYHNYEYIIVDGMSRDNTLNIIKEYKSKFKAVGVTFKYVSEKDNGLYDAMNKGIRMASGDLIGIINSDDILHDDNVFFRISKCNLRKFDGVYSDLIMYDEALAKIRTVFIAKSGNYRFGWYPPHPTLYLKKDVYDRYGYYNQEFKIAADYDFMVRILKNNVKLKYINKTNVTMREGGASTGSIKKYWIANKEIYTILKKNKVKFPLIVTVIRFNRAVINKIKTKKNKKKYK